MSVHHLHNAQAHMQEAIAKMVILNTGSGSEEFARQQADSILGLLALAQAEITAFIAITGADDDR